MPILPIVRATCEISPASEAFSAKTQNEGCNLESYRRKIAICTSVRQFWCEISHIEYSTVEAGEQSQNFAHNFVDCKAESQNSQVIFGFALTKWQFAREVFKMAGFCPNWLRNFGRRGPDPRISLTMSRIVREISALDA
jgi:hypothetical protein